MYLVIYEKDGEQVATVATHAADEAGAEQWAALFYDRHPEHDPRRTVSGLVVRTEKITSA